MTFWREVIVEVVLQLFQKGITSHDRLAMIGKDIVDGGYMSDAISSRETGGEAEFHGRLAQFGSLDVVSVDVCCRATR